MNDGKNVPLFLAAGAAVALAGLGVWRLVVKPRPEAVPEAPPAATAPAAALAESLPKLEDSDAWVRGKASALSSDARFADWLKVDNLLSRWAAAVNIVGRGKVPGDALAFLRPKRKFAPLRQGGRLLVDPRSYERYDAVADAFGSVDAKAAGVFFAAARPLIDQAWAGLGEGKESVVDALGRAARELLAAPPAPVRAELKPSEKGIVYAYADASLERLSPAQKQMMRMGPRNEAKVQAEVRELARAFGVPEAALR